METPDLIPAFDRRTLVVDSFGAIALTLFVWAQMYIPRLGIERRLGIGVPGGPPPMFLREVAPPAAFLLAALCILPLALRRRFPIGVLVTVSALTVLYERTSFQPGFVLIAMLVALYTAATVLERGRLALWAGACGLVVLAASLPPTTSLVFWADGVRTLALLSVATALGVATHNRRAYYVEVMRRAAAAEGMAEEEARRRVDEERLRIARELHDITAHSLSIVAVQSGAALHVLDRDPAEARRSLEAIRQTSRDSLAELRAMLGVLRASGEPEAGAPLAPTPGLSRLSDLIGPLCDAGLDVSVEHDTGSESLPAIVDASAYRIVQEALTNVLRHAGQAKVRVRAVREMGSLVIEVTDDGSASGTPAEGHGIAGMRERAIALGGTFEAGPASGGGWRVLATHPLSGRAQTP